MNLQELLSSGQAVNITISLSDLDAFVKGLIQDTKEVFPVPDKKYIYSIKELAKLLNCSIVTAQKVKNSGRIPFMQEGRTLIFECGEVLAALNPDNGKKNVNKNQRRA